MKVTIRSEMHGGEVMALRLDGLNWRYRPSPLDHWLLAEQWIEVSPDDGLKRPYSVIWPVAWLDTADPTVGNLRDMDKART